jgi:hypothetical protein
MRQGGMKPKSHKSGVHWVRANAQSGRRRTTPEEKPMQINGFAIGLLIIVCIIAAPVVLCIWLYDKFVDKSTG